MYDCICQRHFSRRNGSYPFNLRTFSYIIENDISGDDENITTIKVSMLRTNCYQTCVYMPKEIMYYPGHLIKYAMSPSRRETLEEGTVLMGNLEKIRWVVLKSGYNIKPYSELENELYSLNNGSVKHNNRWYTIDGKQHQMLYK